MVGLVGPIIGVGAPLIAGALVTLGRVGISRILTRRLGSAGTVGIVRKLAPGAALGGAIGLAGTAVDILTPGGGPVMQQVAPPMRAPAVRPADVVIGGQGPVTFVKMWRAGEAVFAIDSEGKRWAWRPKLGIWKRTRVFNNIVISRKDVFRARRLIRTSKRLNAIRKGLR